MVFALPLVAFVFTRALAAPPLAPAALAPVADAADAAPLGADDVVDGGTIWAPLTRRGAPAAGEGWCGVSLRSRRTALLTAVFFLAEPANAPSLLIMIYDNNKRVKQTRCLMQSSLSFHAGS